MHTSRESKQLGVTLMIYTAVLEPEPDGRYSAQIPAFPGVHSWGATRQEALEHVIDAAVLWIDVEQELGRAVPPNDPVVLLAEVNRVIADQRLDGLDPQLELVSVSIPGLNRQAA
jgi:predicted RNase H-like HicB family nuclease